MKLQTTLAITAAALGLLLGVQVFMSVHPHTQTSTQMMAIWQDNPQNMEELEALSDEIFIGKVIKIERAEPLQPLDVENLEGIDVSIEAELITFEVTTQLKGKKRTKAETVQLFHLGNSNLKLERKKAPPGSERPDKPDEGAVTKADAPKFNAREEAEAAIPITLHDDSAYTKGEEYALFVRKGRSLTVNGKSVETLAIVHPSGRNQIKNGKINKPFAVTGFATKLKGKPVDDLKAKIAKIRKGKPKG